MTEGVRVVGAKFRWQPHHVLGDDGLAASVIEDTIHGLDCSPEKWP
jgi:hypothetical protein